LLIEILSLKFVPPVFAPVTALQEPAFVQPIPSTQRRDYKFFDLADTGAFGIPSVSQRVNIWLDRMQEAVAPSSNLLWDVPSFGGAFALNLARQAMVESHLRGEAAGDIKQAPGLRLLDFIGIRYLAAPAALSAPGLTLQRHDEKRLLYFYVNEFAQPRFQHYGHAALAPDAASAFEQIKHLQQRTLVIEADATALNSIGAETTAADEGFSFIATKAESDHYSFDVDAAHGGWLFIADNMYPGWTATLDGKATPLFAAQVMGKSVWVPAGKHQVDVRFISRSFQIGLAITLVTIVAIPLLLLIDRRRRHRR